MAKAKGFSGIGRAAVTAQPLLQAPRRVAAHNRVIGKPFDASEDPHQGSRQLFRHLWKQHEASAVLSSPDEPIKPMIGTLAFTKASADWRQVMRNSLRKLDYGDAATILRAMRLAAITKEDEQ